jgi:hypothetical protein
LLKVDSLQLKCLLLVKKRAKVGNFGELAEICDKKSVEKGVIE